MFQEPFGAGPRRLVVLAAAAYAACLVVATHHPDAQHLVGGKLPSDKLLHLAAYGALGLLAALLLRARGRLVGGMTPLLGAGLAAWAVIDEVTQPLFGRTADPLDWVCDVIGITLGIGAGVIGTKLVDRRQARRAE